MNGGTDGDGVRCVLEIRLWKGGEGRGRETKVIVRYGTVRYELRGARDGGRGTGIEGRLIRVTLFTGGAGDGDGDGNGDWKGDWGLEGNREGGREGGK